MSDQTCGNCKFYEPGSKSCRRFPPVPYPIGQDAQGITCNSFFPGMQAHGWCGEWKIKLELVN